MLIEVNSRATASRSVWPLLGQPSNVTVVGRHPGAVSGPNTAGKIGMQLARYVKFRKEQFGVVLFETQTEKVYTLNPTAAAGVREILSGIDTSETPGPIKDRFRDPAGKIEQEVRALIVELQLFNRR
jgi:hypothetical protein